MGKFILKTVIGLIVIGAIFGAGVIVGGGFAQEAAQNAVTTQLEQCLPITDAGQLDRCLSEAEAAQ